MPIGAPGASLTAEEFQALRDVLAGRIISDADRDRLLELGLIDEKLGGPALTVAGKVRLAYGQ